MRLETRASWVSEIVARALAIPWMPLPRLGVGRHRHEAVAMLKDAVTAACRLMERCLGRRVALTDPNTRPPISTLGYATAPRDQTAVFRGGAFGSKKAATTTRANARPGDQTGRISGRAF